MVIKIGGSTWKTSLERIGTMKKKELGSLDLHHRKSDFMIEDCMIIWWDIKCIFDKKYLLNLQAINSKNDAYSSY
jgi:hypothetical protein